MLLLASVICLNKQAIYENNLEGRNEEKYDAFQSLRPFHLISNTIKSGIITSKKTKKLHKI